MALSNLLQLILLEHGSWSRRSPEVPSNLNYSMSLCALGCLVGMCSTIFCTVLRFFSLFLMYMLISHRIRLGLQQYNTVSSKPFIQEYCFRSWTWLYHQMGQKIHVSLVLLQWFCLYCLYLWKHSKEAPEHQHQSFLHGRKCTYCNSHYSLYTKFMWGKEGKGLKSLITSQLHTYISSASRGLVYSRERGQETSLLLVNKSVSCPQTINCHRHYFQVSSRITGLCFLGCDRIWTKHRTVQKASSIWAELACIQSIGYSGSC